MFGKDHESRVLSRGLVMAVVVVLALIALARLEGPESVIPAPAPVPPPAQPVVQVLSPTRIAADAAARPIATVYECEGATEGRVLSDAPCGEGAVVREVIAPNRMDTYMAPRSTASETSRAHSVPHPATPSDDCAGIQLQIDRINKRMRNRYSAREGEWMREKLRELSDRRYRCPR
jgi:hypothetical protein